MSNYKYILFDFDGTLTDSSEGIFKSLTYAFESYGHGTPSLDLLKKFKISLNFLHQIYYNTLYFTGGLLC